MTGILTILYLLQILFSDCFATSKLIKTAVNITSTYYSPHFTTTVIWKKNESEYVNEYLKNYPGSVVLSPWSTYNDSKIRAINETVGFKQTIYFATTLNDYEIIMQLINEVIRFPIRFILVLENPVQTNAEISSFIEVTAKNDQADLILISANEAGKVSMSTFFPYSDGSCGNYTPIFLKYGDNMFPKKFSNFYQCPIRTALLEYFPYVTVEIEDGKITSVGGYDGKILMIILHQLNASLEVTSSYNNSVFGTYVNGTATGSIGDLATEKADILIPADILTEKRYTVTLPSHTYHTVDIRWVGRRQREVSDWLKCIVPDKTNFTYLHGLVYISFLIVAMLVRKCKPQMTSVTNRILFQSFIILLGQSAKFVTKSWLLNFLFVLWIWFCFFFRIDYQADLVDALQTIDLEPPFKSIEDAVTKVDGFGGVEVVIDYYRDTPLEHKYQVIPMNELRTYIWRIFKGENFLLATDVALVRSLESYVQILEKRISSTGASFYMRPGWPAAKDVDDVIFSLVEAGFIENLLSDHNNQKWVINRNHDDDVISPASLSMTKLSTLFYALGFMWIVCSIVFVIEIKHHKNKMKKLWME
uniref:Putative ionotropic receptor IR7d.3 n=1 Tax=Athetis lepigone TaxID=1223490 RepID=A0A1B3B738_ATHLE|nr:putative ionotropic receptor IR7d.3 [Athetis lepigone]